MIKNYLKVAFRNLVKKKYYSFLNLLGLSIGITAGILIILYVQEELSYDRFHPAAEQKYVIGLNGKVGTQDIQGIFTPPPLAEAAVEEIPGVVQSTRTNAAGYTVLRNDDQAFTENRIYWADSNFYDFFGYELKRGDPETALEGPNKVVLTESTARKYFGDENPIGKSLEVGNDRTVYEVTGVNEDPPSNSHFQFDVLLSFGTTDYSRSTQWLSNSINTYIEVSQETDLSQLKAGLDNLIAKYVGPEIQEFAGITLDQLRERGGEYGYFAVPVLDLHLNAPDVQTSFEPPGDITYVYIFSAIGVFLILIACVNFMNLSTASASSRAKEVGLRKTLGSDRNSMIAQFLVESILYVLLATLLSVIMIYLVLPWFNQLSGKELTLQIFTEAWFLLSLGGMALLVGLIAGSYPAFYLTSFNPVEVLKGKIERGARSGGFRRTLVVVQFFISIGLIICTLLVNQQLQFMQEKDLGIVKEQSLVLTNTSRLGSNRGAFKQDLMSDTRIQAASYSNFTIPGTGSVTVFQRPNQEGDYMMALYYADYEQQETLGFEMAEGRFFDRDFPTDSSAIVINQAAVQELGFEDPVGKEIQYPAENNTRYRIVGVMEDFNFQSLRNEIMPLGIMLINSQSDNANEMIIRFNADNTEEMVQLTEETWEKYAGTDPIDYSFLEQDFDQLFRQEQRLGSVFMTFTIIAIFIACLGLLGLTAYMAERRTQEIGIRKVLGASVSSILGLLSTEFLKLVGIAFLLAAPVAWWFIGEWLQNFAYRISISPMVFLKTALATLFIVLLTISWQTLKAARMDPVNSIQTE